MQRPEIISDTWLNSTPLHPDDLDGKIVLVNFWSYCCGKCRQMLPHVSRWWQRYRDYDLLIIGIHTPEFEFAKEPANVEQAVRDLGIQWPVVVDSDYINWKLFGSRNWPSVFLFDTGGRLIFEQAGDGKYEESEVAIQEAVRQTFGNVKLPDVEPDGHPHERACFIPTPELHCGYARGRLDNSEGYNFDIPFRYLATKDPRRDSIALLGSFIAKPEYLESADIGATLLLQFRATEVNVVLSPVEPETRIRLTYNGKTLPEEIKGYDVNGSGEAAVEKPALYNLIRSDHPLDGILGITARAGNFQAYVFTFSGCMPEEPSVMLAHK
jgi:thiol-disulfide isomerase/thioredoxin